MFREQLAGTDDPRLLANLSVALHVPRRLQSRSIGRRESRVGVSTAKGAVPTLLFASSFELVARLVLGDWDRARADAAELHALALDSENRSELDDFVWTQAYVAAARGDADRYAALEVLVDPARDPRVALCGGLIALGLEEPVRAVGILGPLVSRAYAGRITRTPDMSPFDLVEAHLRCGEEQRGRAPARGVRALHGPRLGGGRTGALPRVRTRLRLRAALRGEPARSSRRSGSRSKRREPISTTASCSAESGAAGRLEESLAQALAAFERLAARPWAARARAGLRAAGVKTELSARPDRSRSLSEREHRVALAAAEGGTNREIAAELFVSPRTVELHLGSAYRKLGVRRRSELARLVDGRGMPKDT